MVRYEQGVTGARVTDNRALLAREVTVPAAWAAILAAGLAGLAATIAALIGDAAGWPWWAPALAGAVTWLGVFTWRAWRADADRRRLLLWQIERLAGLDLDADGEIGEPPEAEPRLIFVHDARRERRQASGADFRAFLRGAYDGRGTTWRAWDGERLPSGRRVSRPVWEEYTERLQRAGLAIRPYRTGELELHGTYRDALAAFREAL